MQKKKDLAKNMNNMVKRDVVVVTINGIVETKCVVECNAGAVDPWAVVVTSHVEVVECSRVEAFIPVEVLPCVVVHIT